jgi:hypothetical protein
LITAIDALANWRDEIETVNERCLGKVLDQTSSVVQAMGWPEQTIEATREYFQTISKVQAELIDRMSQDWKRHLRSPTAPLAFPRGLADQMSGFPGSTAPLPEFNPLAPWAFWMQAVEAWQRAWMPGANSGNDRSH